MLSVWEDRELDTSRNRHCPPVLPQHFSKMPLKWHRTHVSLAPALVTALIRLDLNTEVTWGLRGVKMVRVVVLGWGPIWNPQ